MSDQGLKTAKVVGVYPDGYSVDVVFYDDGSHASNVQVLSGPVSTRTGFNDLPSPDVPAGGDKWSMQDSGTTDMIAVVGFVRGVPVVIGFLYPQVNQMLFADKNRMVYRHASGVYFTIDKAGNTELSHPSGAFMRFGATPAHEDLTGKDLDGNWKIPVTAPVNIHVEQAGGVASVNIDPSGNVAIENAGTLTSTTTGDVVVTSLANATLSASVSATVKAPSISLKNLGSALKSLCTSAFMDLFNDHTHTSSAPGSQTSKPTQQASDGTHTTTIVKAE